MITLEEIPTLSTIEQAFEFKLYEDVMTSGTGCRFLDAFPGFTSIVSAAYVVVLSEHIAASTNLEMLEAGSTFDSCLFTLPKERVGRVQGTIGHYKRAAEQLDHFLERHLEETGISKQGSLGTAGSSNPWGSSWSRSRQGDEMSGGIGTSSIGESSVTDGPDNNSQTNSSGIKMGYEASAEVIPASDRKVSYDHNSAEAIEAEETAEALEVAFDSVNDIEDLDPEIQFQMAQFRAGHQLLTAPMITKSDFEKLILRPLKYLVTCAISGIIGSQANTAYEAFQSLAGVLFP